MIRATLILCLVASSAGADPLPVPFTGGNCQFGSASRSTHSSSGWHSIPT
jgi:hypothetical protein